ncbi:hypothetical protein [uncultured Megasphaera sp.]|uniref:hypothetical protein n=1 Tax=uncultured Megasphaera sp. TaxID=165188 RepID=UPI00259A022D|nr:hypothetical protein [uncultured Megasphaera sp.]
MIKKIASLVFMASFLCAGASAYNPYAPNQFAIVQHNEWEYRAGMKIFQSGLIPEGANKFSPSYALTRFELTQLVALAVHRRNKADKDIQTLIDSLQRDLQNDLSYVDPSIPALRQKGPSA